MTTTPDFNTASQDKPLDEQLAALNERYQAVITRHEQAKADAKNRPALDETTKNSMLDYLEARVSDSNAVMARVNLAAQSGAATRAPHLFADQLIRAEETVASLDASVTRISDALDLGSKNRLAPTAKP